MEQYFTWDIREDILEKDDISYQFIDSLQDEHIEQTLFMEDERFITSIVDQDGNRAEKEQADIGGAKNGFDTLSQIIEANVTTAGIIAEKTKNLEELKQTMSLVDSSEVILDGNHVTLGEKQKIDLGGIAKGYIADRLKEYLISQDVKSAIINLGGNVLCIGGKPDGAVSKAHHSCEQISSIFFDVQNQQHLSINQVGIPL